MKNFAKKLLIYLIVTIGAFFVTAIIYTFSTEGRLIFSLAIFNNNIPYIVAIFAFFAFLLYDLMKILDGKGKKKKGDKASDKVRDTKGKEVQQFFNRDFVTEDMLKTEPKFNYNTMQTIRSCKKDGILVRAEETNGKMEINFVPPIHALVVGTTSSGKTQRFVEPTLQVMSMTASKPSFVITDPKGELYDYNSNKMRNEGYEVFTIDLREPFASVQWNPLAYPFDLYTESFNLDKLVKVHPPGDNPKTFNLIMETPFDYHNTTWFEFRKYAYVNKERLEQDMQVEATTLKDEAFNALNDISSTLAPIENEKDPSWERTAQRLIHAVMLAMLEDSRIPELGLTKEKFNLYNVQKISNMTDSGRDIYATLKKYLFEYRDKFSKVNELASTALNNAENTSKNYMGFVSSKTAIFSDTAISHLTSQTEMDFISMDDKPTAIFVKIPDEIKTRHPLAVLFVTQLYKRLVGKANTLGGKLKRNVYFLLDEFGNLPKFPEFGSIMTVGRGRGIYFELCVQSYGQLYQKYGQDEGKIIKDNCPIQVYIATEDMQTNKEFSELLGKKTIEITNVTTSKGPDGKDNKTESKQVQSIPIAYPEELMTFRDKGEIVVKTFEPNAALKTKVTYAYQAKSYDRTRVFGTYIARRFFDESKVYYDIKIRNSKMSSKTSSNSDDDDDFDFF